jgi:Copper transport outer membrane protein, MctB
MGYSARYHAASLAAVFLALAIGILIGAEFGGDVVSNTRKDLEKSITADLADARGRVDDLAGELGRANEFADRIYPVLARDKLAGRRIGILGLGGLPGGLSSEIESALEPTGANLVAVGVIREPPDLEALSGDLSGTRFADISSNPDTVQALGTGFGRQLVIGGNLLEKVGSKMFSRVSGRFGNLDGLVVVRETPKPLNDAEEESVSRLDSGLLDGVSGTAVNAVGVEATDADPSSISFFADHNLSTVDDIDLSSGKVATVFALLGAEGNFGIKGSADRLLPDLLAPGPVVPAPAQGGGEGGSASGGAGGSGQSK